MMKKLILGAAAIVLAGGIVACGPTSEPTETPTDPTVSAPTTTDDGKPDVQLKVWGPAEEEEIYAWAFETYNANPNRKYDASYVFESVGEDKADTELAKNVQEGATLYFYADDKAVNLMNNNAISYLSGKNATFVEDNFGELAIDSATFSGEIIGYPVQNDNMWFANYDSQYLTAEEASSLETVLAKAEELGKKVQLPIDTGWYVIPSFFSMIDLYWTLDGTGTGRFTTTLDSEESVASAAYLNNLFATYMKKGILTIGQGLGGETNSIYTWNGAWEYGKYAENIGAENLVLTTTPTYKVGDTTHQCVSFLGSKLLSVNGSHSAEKVELGHEIAQILVGKEGSLKRYEVRNSIPANTEALADTRYADNKKPTVLAIEAQSQLDNFNQAKTVQGGDIWGIMGDALGKGLAGTSNANDETTGLINDWAAYLKEQAERIRGLTF